MNTSPRPPEPGPTLSSVMAPERDAALRVLLIDTVTDVAATDARPAPERLAGRRIRIGVAAAVAVTAATGFLVLRDTGAPPAYAAWTPLPATAPGAVVSSGTMKRWASTCSDLGVGGVSVQGVPSRREAAAARDVLIDRRGSYTYCVDVSPGTATDRDPLMAISGIRAEAGPEKGLNRTWSTVFDRPYTRPAGAGVLVLGGDLEPLSEPTEPGVVSLRAYQLYGMAGADVTGVDIVLTDGLRITATVQDGIWGAWWPMDKGDLTGGHLEVHAGAKTRVVDPAHAGLPWKDSESGG